MEPDDDDERSWPGLQTRLRDLRATLLGAEALAHSSSTWYDKKEDPVVRLLSVACTDLELEVMPRIEACCAGARTEQERDGSQAPASNGISAKALDDSLLSAEAISQEGRDGNLGAPAQAGSSSSDDAATSAGSAKRSLALDATYEIDGIITMLKAHVPALYDKGDESSLALKGVLRRLRELNNAVMSIMVQDDDATARLWEVIHDEPMPGEEVNHG